MEATVPPESKAAKSADRALKTAIIAITIIEAIAMVPLVLHFLEK
jgi:hypothetical protein